MNVLYFAHNVEDAAVLKRARHLRHFGARVQIIGFSRFSSSPKIVEEAIIFGRTFDGRFFQRSVETGKAIIRMREHRRHLDEADLIICRNLEALAVAIVALRVAGLKRPVFYECLDIHAKMLAGNPASRLLRWLERRLMRETAGLITSSGAFVREYFSPIQRYDGAVILLENKLLPSDFTPSQFDNPVPDSPPWIIGWFGIIRCRKSLKMLDEITKVGNVRVHIAGRVSHTQIPDFENTLEKNPNITYSGPYVASDIPALFGACHFVWAIDYYEEGKNSSWLLPNRLYDSLAAKRVPIALAQVETGRWLREYNAGKVVESPVEDLTDFLQTLTAEGFVKHQEQVKQVPNSAIFHDADSLRFIFTADARTHDHDDR